MDLRPALSDGRLTVEQIDPAEMSPGEFAKKVQDAVALRKTRVVIIDSLNGYMNSMPSETFLQIHLHELLSYLNNQGVLSLIVLAHHGVLGLSLQAPVDVTYLADTVIMLRYFEAFGEVRQAVTVIKKRTGPHERAIRQFQLTANGIVVGEPLHDFEGIMTGTPTYRGKREELLPESHER
jgi:circadian clock protein KaiC